MKKILFLILLVAILYFGGFNFLKNAYSSFNNPPREKTIESAKFFGDFSHVPSDYVLKHTLGLFDYKFLTVVYKPSGQKIYFMTFGDKNVIKYKDFSETNLNITLQNFTKNKFFEKIFEQDFKIAPKALQTVDKHPIKYSIIDYKIKVFPFKKMKAYFGIYQVENASKTNKDSDLHDHEVLILSIFENQKFSSLIVKNFLQKMYF